MKILLTAPFDKVMLERLELVANVVIGPQEETRLLEPAEVTNLLQQENPDIFVTEINPVNAAALDAAPNLRLLGVCRTGLDNIDLEYASRRKISVINAPGRNATSVAEFTIGLMISLGRYLVESAVEVKQRRWQDATTTWNRYMGSELAGKTAGIIGLGAIGKAVAKRLQCFQMKILAYDPYIPDTDFVAFGGEKTRLEDLLRESDYVLLHAPVTPETRGMLDLPKISLMKHSAFLVNMARAALIDENALIATLKDRKIAGAALDVHKDEPLPLDSPWLDLDNVILTPHIAGCTTEIISNHSKMIGEDILRFCRGEKPERLVNPSAWSGLNNEHCIPCL